MPLLRVLSHPGIQLYPVRKMMRAQGHLCRTMSHAGDAMVSCTCHMRSRGYKRAMGAWAWCSSTHRCADSPRVDSSGIDTAS